MLLEYAKTAGGIQEVDQAHGLPTQAAPLTTATALSADATVSPGTQFVINCTSEGDVKVDLSGGGSITIAVAVGTTILPWAVTKLYSTGTTATVTCYNMN